MMTMMMMMMMMMAMTIATRQLNPFKFACNKNITML